MADYIDTFKRAASDIQMTSVLYRYGGLGISAKAAPDGQCCAVLHYYRTKQMSERVPRGIFPDIDSVTRSVGVFLRIAVVVQRSFREVGVVIVLFVRHPIRQSLRFGTSESPRIVPVTVLIGNPHLCTV